MQNQADLKAIGNQSNPLNNSSPWRFRTDLYRRALIDRIQAGEAEGTLEKHPEYGWLITRTEKQAKDYDKKYGIVARGDWVKKIDKKWMTHEELKAA